MQLVHNSAFTVITPQSQSLSTAVSTETTNIKPSRSPKLSMVWVREFDGDKYRLVAKWVSDN
ncbi:hypothetical protein NIES4071_43760 [Calothrix sp. NIES-4071]|nr:hypothetical protein NIES4071_43760 [Calothrix sp. NIES-4071]BAZ58690.1 hypothetical protein NIES4105_43690 [Calothrix sp. NIES-4105]